MAEGTRYGNMVGVPQYEEHYNVNVWVSPLLDTLRRSDSLCYNCIKFRPNGKDECPIARKIFEVCKAENVALPISRCPAFEQS